MSQKIQRSNITGFNTDKFISFEQSLILIHYYIIKMKIILRYIFNEKICYNKRFSKNNVTFPNKSYDAGVERKYTENIPNLLQYNKS